MNAIVHPTEFEPDPLEIDPRPCELCGRTIDQHERVDAPEGPEFFCDDLEYQIHLDAADLVRRLELADLRDSWKHTGEAPPPENVRNSDISGKPEKPQRPYSTPDSVVDAFFFIVRTKNADGILEWLSKRPLDAPYLHKLWKLKCSTAPAK